MSEQKYKCVKIVEDYLDAIGIIGYTIETSQDDMGLLIVINIPKSNNAKIGVLKGKDSRNLTILKQLVRIVGFLEKKNPYLIIKLIEN